MRIETRYCDWCGDDIENSVTAAIISVNGVKEIERHMKSKGRKNYYDDESFEDLCEYCAKDLTKNCNIKKIDWGGDALILATENPDSLTHDDFPNR